MAPLHSPGPEADDGRPSAADLMTTDDGDGQWTVHVRGELDVAELPKVRSCLSELLDRHPRRVILDLTDMTFIDSSGLGMLVSTLKRTHELGDTTLILKNLQEPVRRVFEITKLTELFQIVP